jgi:hypothetical protein
VLRTVDSTALRCAQEAQAAPRSSASYYTPDFLCVFQLYPSKTARELAFQTWQSLHPDAVLAVKMMVALRWQLTDGVYLPNCFHLWLQDRRWEDIRRPTPISQLSFKEREAARAREEADRLWAQHD